MRSFGEEETMDAKMWPSMAVPLARLNPEFLKSNATSHIWIFSAIAEIVDNAYDPDVKAKRLNIEYQSNFNGHEALFFKDDGRGMEREKLHRMLSFGYSSKQECTEYKAVGRYGNGFKSGSMRLGRDALVLTKEAGGTVSVGFLSQTYHDAINADHIRVPMVTWRSETGDLVDESDRESLEIILRYSPIKEEVQLLTMLANIPEFGKKQQPGTTIVIYNLNLTSPVGSRDVNESAELKFDSGNADIVNPTALEHEPDIRRSLRKYLQYLYKDPRMKICLLGKTIRHRLITRDLASKMTQWYRREGQEKIDIIMGFNPKKLEPSDQNYGVMLYHNNRLITAFEKVGCQKQSNDRGHGVVAVVEADYLEPIHNKQAFSQDENYRRVMDSIAKAVNMFCDVKEQGGSEGSGEQEEKCFWVLCDRCNKHRRLPPEVNSDDLPEEWFCEMHPEGYRCEIPEEGMEPGERQIDAVKVRRKRKRQRIEQQKELFEMETKKIKEEELEKYNKRRFERLQRMNKMLQKMAMAVATSFGRLPGEVRNVVEELHREKAGVNGVFPFIQCSKCEEWRQLRDKQICNVDKDRWKCAFGGFQCADPNDSQGRENPGGNPVTALLLRQQSDDEGVGIQGCLKDTFFSPNLPTKSIEQTMVEIEDNCTELSEKEKGMEKDLEELKEAFHMILDGINEVTKVQEEETDNSEMVAEISRLQKELKEKEETLLNVTMEKNQLVTKYEGSSRPNTEEKPYTLEDLESCVLELVGHLLPNFIPAPGASILEIIQSMNDAYRDSPSPSNPEYS